MSSAYQTSAACSLRWWARTSWATAQGTLVGISNDGAEVVSSGQVAAGNTVTLEIHGYDVGPRETSVVSCSMVAGGYRLVLKLLDGSWPYAAFTTLISLGGATPTTLTTPSSLVAPPCFEKLALSFPCTTEDVETAFYKQVRRVHPDRGGDVAAFMELRNAFLQAMEFLNDDH